MTAMTPPPYDFSKLTQREGYSGYVEAVYNAVTKAGLWATLKRCPSLDGVSIYDIPDLVGVDVLNAILTHMPWFTASNGPNLYYGAIHQIVEIAKSG
jgi:hypothetical protein